MAHDIYKDGKIFTNYQDLPLVKLWDGCYSVEGSHNFHDGQCVDGLYELKNVCAAPNCDCKNGTPPYCRYNSLGKRVAIPVAPRESSEARDKATELVDGFRGCLRASSAVREMQQAKQCALFHCDEMIKECREQGYGCIVFYQHVRKEI
jgi:hypothetical protein